MKLSSIQQEIVRAWLQNKATDTEKFLLQFGDFERFILQQSYPGWDLVCDPKTTGYIPKNRDKTISELTEFISLWSRLEREGLVTRLRRASKGVRLLPIFASQNDAEHEIMGIIRSYDGFYVAPLPELSDFVDRGFLTLDEQRFAQDAADRKQEAADRKQAQQLTFRIAVVSIVVSLLMGFFQFVTYKTQRDVLITNMNAFRDTTRVLVLNPERIKADTPAVKQQTGLNKK
ncbi:MAG: hypothetical protein ABSF91_05110 [Bacteroidota bacterium]|jgi:hypothetical protein